MAFGTLHATFLVPALVKTSYRWHYIYKGAVRKEDESSEARRIEEWMICDMETMVDECLV